MIATDAQDGIVKQLEDRYSKMECQVLQDGILEILASSPEKSEDVRRILVMPGGSILKDRLVEPPREFRRGDRVTFQNQLTMRWVKGIVVSNGELIVAGSRYYVVDTPRGKIEVSSSLVREDVS